MKNECLVSGFAVRLARLLTLWLRVDYDRRSVDRGSDYDPEDSRCTANATSLNYSNFGFAPKFLRKFQFGSSLMYLTMAKTMTLSSLPEDILIQILQTVCESILDDLLIFRVCPEQDERFGLFLNQFLQLNLVCRSFHRHLTHSVRVRGTPVRRKLLDLQTEKFKYLLETVGFIMREHNRMCSPDFNSFWSITIPHILLICGSVWNNPSFPSIFPQLFVEDSRVSYEAQLYLLYLVPSLFEKELVENDDYTADSDLEFDFDSLMQNHTYRFPDEEEPFEFVPGKYRYPHGIEWDDNYYGQPCLGTSILVMKDKELDLKSEEGRYWLWFTPSTRRDCTLYMGSFLVIDNDEFLVIAVNERKWDLRKYGKYIRPVDCQ